MYNFSSGEFISLLVVFFTTLPYFQFSICVRIYNTLYPLCVCRLNTFFFIIHHIPRQRKSAVFYLVYLDIWLLLFRTVPAQILLITLTNIASPLWHKSKQDTVVAPSLGPNLNVSAGVNSGTENPYAFCVYSLLRCKLADIVWSCVWQGSVDQSANKDSW